MASVALVVHTDRPEAVALACRVAGRLAGGGHTVRVPDTDAKAAELQPFACAEDALAEGLDVAVSFGGDGTMLRTVDLVAARDVPVLGVNVGHLGYLTAVEASGLDGALERLLVGDFEIEERMTLGVVVDGEPPVTRVALNEAVLEKTTTGHTVRLAVSINDRFFTTYAADGMIVATPTGSTAYSLSARGPIVSPCHRAMLLTPVAPHMLFDRTLVLDPSETIRVEVIDGRAALLSVDGRTHGELAKGQGITCTAGPHNAKFVTFGGRDFHRILKAKFGLADR